MQRSDTLRRANTIVEHFAPTFVIVDEIGQTLYFSSGTGKYLQPAAGPPNRDIVAMARAGLRAGLRAALHRAKETGQRVVRDRVHLQINGGIQMVSLTVEPIIEGKEMAYGVVFTDRGPISAQAEPPRTERTEGQERPLN